MEEGIAQMAEMAAIEQRFESVFQMLVPISGLSPTRPGSLPGVPPVLVPDAMLWQWSRATAPTVPIGAPGLGASAP